MIKLGEINKQPEAVGWYVFTKIILLLSAPTLPVLIIADGHWWFATWLTIMIPVGIPMLIWGLLRCSAVRFMVDTNKIEINWGIIMKKTRTILIKAVQNVKIEKGILPNLFGVWIVNIWTASQSQNTNDRKNPNKPDGLLILTKEDSEWLSDFIASSK